ncbi:NAD-dependent dehydratase [Sphingobacteriales bacterium UPWRP_1]|nr:hypothetical protein B6N25_07600 [Sphingobacteriales bacterium TSM_CSS]PSJ74766.1 NAD-dependent dehydratase [Sphingobacteriales bacterium UPWRP_1]
MSELHVIFGTGPLGRYTAEALLQEGHLVKLINRTGKMELPPTGAEVIKADALNTNEIILITKGAKTIYQCAQPPYHQWKEAFPALQKAILKVAAENGVKLVAAENLYMYGNTNGKPMTEATPYNPCSKKGKIRTEMTNALFAAYKRVDAEVAAVRGSDFFGPWEPINGDMIFKAALQHKTINMLGNLEQPHTFTYVKDFGKALAIAGTHEQATGKVWHVPSGRAYTQKELLKLLSEQLGYEVKGRGAGKFMLSFIGLFNPGVQEVVEMLYEFTGPFIMDATAMEATFGLKPTPMEQRIAETLEWARAKQ